MKMHRVLAEAAAADSEAIIVHLQETAGKATTATVKLNTKLLGRIAKATEVNFLERGLIVLASVVVIAPMLGFLGTVSGMIKAFENLGSAGIGDPSGLAAAIGEVLVATLTGLAVAIPAFGAFYYLRSRGLAAIHHIQDTVAVLFRKMPYDQLHGAHVGGEEIYAAPPNWSGAAAAEASAH